MVPVAGSSSPAAAAPRAVLFDAGNTLVRVRGSVGRVYAEVAARHGLGASATALETAFRQLFAERRRSLVGSAGSPHTEQRERAWWRSLVHEVLVRGGCGDRLESTFEPLFAELYETFAQPCRWQVFADVPPCLEFLRAQDVPCAVVSNWDSRLHSVLGGLGLRPHFRFVLTSVEFGAEKPDPAIFREAARRLGLLPGAVLHVGDQREDDLAGARRAGLRALQVDRAAAGSPDPAVIADLRQLRSLFPKR